MNVFLKWFYSFWLTTVQQSNRAVYVSLKVLIIICLCKFTYSKTVLEDVQHVQQIGFLLDWTFFSCWTVENTSNSESNNILQNNRCVVYIYNLKKNIYYYTTVSYILKSIALLDCWTVGRYSWKVFLSKLSPLCFLFFYSGGVGDWSRIS